MYVRTGSACEIVEVKRIDRSVIVFFINLPIFCVFLNFFRQQIFSHVPLPCSLRFASFDCLEDRLFGVSLDEMKDTDSLVFSRVSVSKETGIFFY